MKSYMVLATLLGQIPDFTVGAHFIPTTKATAWQGLFGNDAPQPTQVITCAYNFAILSGGFPDFAVGCHPNLHIPILQMVYLEATTPTLPCDKFYVPVSSADVNPSQYGITLSTSHADCDRRIYLEIVPIEP
ncbi:hypothetical protein DL98DRAFT_527898 [Cadophora sp. DSE1049]|nr:hypothetical protein DL98DRAFT_527898 [Cadophora sp. DSE1049]